jgi:hypothetical protein
LGLFTQLSLKKDKAVNRTSMCIYQLQNEIVLPTLLSQTIEVWQVKDISIKANLKGSPIISQQ